MTQYECPICGLVIEQKRMNNLVETRRALLYRVGFHMVEAH